jgi:hypothetical protein
MVSFAFPELTSYETYTLLLYIGIVILTSVYAYFTYKLFSETRKMREIQINPKLSIYLSSEQRVLKMKNLVIANIGLGPAYNIKFKLSPDFTLFDGKLLSEIHLIKTGIPYMAPNYKYEFLLTDVNYQKYADNCFTIEVNYQNSLKETLLDVFLMDFSLWKNLTMVNPKGLADVVVELQNIKASIEQVKIK